MSQSTIDAITDKLLPIHPTYATSVIQALAYTSQVLIEQARPEQGPQTLAAINKLSQFLISAVKSTAAVDLAILYDEPCARNLFKLGLSTLHIFDVPRMIDARIITDTVFDVIEGDWEEAFINLFTIGTIVMLFRMVFNIGMHATLGFAVFTGLHSYYNTATILYKRSGKIWHESENMVSSKFFNWAVPQEEATIKSVSPTAQITKVILPFNNGHRLYCLEVKTESHGQYFCYELWKQKFAILSEYSYATTMAERIISEKEVRLKSVIQKKARLDLYHKPMFHAEPHDANELNYDDEAISDDKAINWAKKLIKNMFAVSEIQINRDVEKDCLEIKLSLTYQYCDCECLDKNGGNPFTAWCHDSEEQSLIGVDKDL